MDCDGRSGGNNERAAILQVPSQQVSSVPKRRKEIMLSHIRGKDVDLFDSLLRGSGVKEGTSLSKEEFSTAWSQASEALGQTNSENRVERLRQEQNNRIDSLQAILEQAGSRIKKQDQKIDRMMVLLDSVQLLRT